jgi:hypothetical protein
MYIHIMPKLAILPTTFIVPIKVEEKPRPRGGFEE